MKMVANHAFAHHLAVKIGSIPNRTIWRLAVYFSESEKNNSRT
jgi:hypothetical protein